MADDFYGYDEAEAEPKGHDNLFLWTVFILLLIGAAFACWMGSFYVFGHPEKPKPYAILLKLKKIDAPLRFEVTAAPPGEFLTAQKLFERYGKFSRLELENENAELLRNYIRNYRETKKLVTYVTGHYVILDTADLKSTDMFPSGVVALAQAAEFPQVVIEHLYTSSPRTVPAIRANLKTGVDIKLERSNDLAAVIHIERIPEGRMQFTVVPLLYGTYALSSTFSLEPPPALNMVPGLPVVKVDALHEGLAKFAKYRQAHPNAGLVASATDQNAPKPPELVRLDVVPPGQPTPETGPLPQPATATPIPIAGHATPRIAAADTKTATPRLSTGGAPTPIRAPATPPMQITMLTTPAPRAQTPAYTSAPPLPPGATPLPQYSPDGVKLKPFLQSQPEHIMTESGATWKTYSPGQAPQGRNITLEEVPGLLERNELGGRMYLQGEFRVTASGVSRAVLRDATKPDDQSPRIVVEYPAGAVPPAERDRFQRDPSRPYLINDIRRGGDGVVTIYVREIMNQ
jgi:hypothetical protein